MVRKILIIQAITSQLPVNLHLISGETYCGLCKEDEKNPEMFQILTATESLYIYYWAVKRVSFMTTTEQVTKTLT